MGAYVISDKSTYKVAASAVIKARDTVYISATGFAAAGAVPTSGLAGLLVVGSAIEDVNNTGGSDGDKTVTVEHSMGERAFLFAPASLTAADIGKTIYVLTSKTFTTTSTNAITAGKLQGIEDDGRVRVLFPL